MIFWTCILIIDNILPFALAAFYPRFCHKSMPLSVLGSRQSPVRHIYNIWCIISGIVFCLAPYTLYQVNKCKLVLAIWVLFAVYGIGCEIVSGICPLNEKREDEDTITKIHGLSSAIGFIALLFTPLLFAMLQFQIASVVTGVISLFCFVVAFVFFCFFIMGEKERFSDTVLRYGGLWQRLVLVFCYIPIFVWCLNII